ncbi:radical SAM protein [Nostocoides sp.]
MTRGCIYACKFCQTPFLFKARFRHRSIASVREHVRRQLTLDMTDVRFLTPTSMSYGAQGETPDLDAIERLLLAVRAELPSHGRVYFGSFPSEIRPEHASVEALSLVKRLCDNNNVIIGGQSGSDRMLLAAGRGHDTQVVLTASRELQPGRHPGQCRCLVWDARRKRGGCGGDDRLVPGPGRAGGAHPHAHLHAAARHSVEPSAARGDRRSAAAGDSGVGGARAGIRLVGGPAGARAGAGRL